ncbi:hypothetical protein BABINDRAFT_7986 [Babjeviella inositovora NRRL Y-12698]|uniref:Stress-associated endoplasmic reticulum protein n=1 Tax=Babjeviella inositovora NRRL Y-12698 TaxID=984486 RepID=A0A1E3QRW8_9ASCO|nr:uncharacterized protein BABINDRAFT_7986 [Babjeviella inositovora NRRL Y-12698]ODQ79782.1 hypothetical protein BABINDRAFT_7986 [Babjeviella inositovora NRRL Y-12698]
MVCIRSRPHAQQTPKQRAANVKFAKKIEKNMGKPKQVKAQEFPLSKTWIAILAFLIAGGAVLEILRLFF